MKLGYIPPMTKGLTLDRDYVIRLVEMLESQDVESVWTVEHVIMARNYDPLYPYSKDGMAPTAPDTLMPDPLEWHAFAAARTDRINLGTAVVIASQHSAAILAKRVATLDALSGGRVRLGVGIGWQREEYEAVGVPYRDRGRRLDETIEAMRILWRDEWATYHGRHVNFENVHMDTKPFRPEGVPDPHRREHRGRRTARRSPRRRLVPLRHLARGFRPGRRDDSDDRDGRGSRPRPHRDLGLAGELRLHEDLRPRLRAALRRSRGPSPRHQPGRVDDDGHPGPTGLHPAVSGSDSGEALSPDPPRPMTLPLIPVGLLPISAASGLVALQGRLWTVADDETVLFGSSPDGRWDERIELVPDRLPADPAARKRRKPDFESIAVLPDDRLLVLGSGSTPTRRRGVVVDLRARLARVIDLTPLFLVLEAEIAALNIEGAVVQGGTLYLAQRGNGARTPGPSGEGGLARNALVRLDLRRVLASIPRTEIGADALAAILPVALPGLEGVPLGLTDLASDGTDLYFAAAAEDSESTYDDGACLGSALGRLSPDGAVTALRSLEGRSKIEGLALKRTGASGLRAWLVSDPDDRAVRARLFRIEALDLD